MTDGNASSGQVTLELNGQATARMLVVAFVVCGAVAAALFVSIRSAYDLGPPYPRFGDASAPYYELFMLFGALFAGASLVVVKFRQPRGARIEWNAWGFTEWDGDSVCCAIERRKLRVGVHVSKLHGSGLVAGLARAALQVDTTGAIGVALTLADEEGRRIYVGMGTQLAWLNDRLSSVPDLDVLRAALVGVPPREPELGRSAENRVAGAWIAAIVAYVSAMIAAMKILSGKDQEPELLALLAATALFGLLRAWLPCRRAARLARAARGLTEPVTLLENDGPQVVLRGADGQTHRLDPAPLRHPDAGLAQRRGPAWTNAGRTAIETDATRQARRSRLRALRLESLGRLLLPLAALVLLGAQVRKFEAWTLLAAGGPSPVKAVLVQDRMFRAGPSGLEVVYEGGKESVRLGGPVELQGRGPYMTLALRRGEALVFHHPSTTDEGHDLRLMKDGAEVSLPRARLVAAEGEGKAALIVTEAGEGQLWTVDGLEVEYGRSLAEPLSGATTAIFLRDHEGDRLFIGMNDGTVGLHTLDGARLATVDGQDGPVRGLAAEYDTLAVAGGSGVAFFDARTGSRGATFPAAEIAMIAFGSYPSWTHDERHGLLVLTADGTLHAVDEDGEERRRFALPLAAGERPACMTSDPRSILIGTDHGALHELWIR